MKLLNLKWAIPKKETTKKKCINPLKIHTKAVVLDTNRQLQSDSLLREHLDEMKNNYNLNELSWLWTNCITTLKATVNKDSEEQTNEESASAAVASTSTSLLFVFHFIKMFTKKQITL